MGSKNYLYKILTPDQLKDQTIYSDKFVEIKSSSSFEINDSSY